MVYILVVALRKIVVTIVIEAFVTNSQHVIAVDRLHIGTHFGCPLYNGVVFTASIGFTARFIRQFP